jgi:hypothetical protein
MVMVGVSGEPDRHGYVGTGEVASDPGQLVGIPARVDE